MFFLVCCESEVPEMWIGDGCFTQVFQKCFDHVFPYLDTHHEWLTPNRIQAPLEYGSTTTLPSSTYELAGWNGSSTSNKNNRHIIWEYSLSRSELRRFSEALRCVSCYDSSANTPFDIRSGVTSVCSRIMCRRLSRNRRHLWRLRARSWHRGSCWFHWWHISVRVGASFYF